MHSKRHLCDIHYHSEKKLIVKKPGHWIGKVAWSFGTKNYNQETYVTPEVQGLSLPLPDSPFKGAINWVTGDRTI